MSTNEPPAGAPGEPTPPPPASSTPPPPPPPAPAPYPTTPGGDAAAMAAGFPRPAELLDRFLARFIDGIILGVTYGIIAGIVGGVLITGYRDGAELFLYYLIISVISTALYMGYYAYMESNRGQTLGKMVMKLKVVGPDGVSNPTLEQAVKRNIYMAFGLAGIVPVVGSLLGGLASIAAVVLIVIGINGDTVKRQHWFDKFAGGTQVLKVG